MLSHTIRAGGGRRWPFVVVLGLLTSFLGPRSPGTAGEGVAPPAVVRIGLVRSLLRDVPQPLFKAALLPLNSLIQEQTGVHGELLDAGDAVELGEQLRQNKLQLGVFHGFEFAWARQKRTDLVPLCIAVKQEKDVQVRIVVQQGCTARDLAGLKGHSLALPHGGREESWLFIERACDALGPDLRGFFSRITTPANGEDALDDVVDGVVQATVIDRVCLECFQRRKPGRFARLKELQKSEAFPSPVVAYHAGALDDATLRRFREGLIAASQHARGRQFLMLWRLTGFERIPEDYERALTRTLDAYPLHVSGKAAVSPSGTTELAAVKAGTRR